ncbi:MAG: hypothetical protein BJ554DRAFT_3169 [Olpidium bornovanus]|uniref:F-box/LRR-repeat protein 15-like leucin rich repeat domain-containing protein n=1 Tax=Olpidium bornovanus TaxID=278681 RepID=A0A8H7ZPZ8_9FUNG|nr:MAG: hypothetical protein BJ554DRAFT_3169 [Olpidium bornovanus]
MRKLVFYKLKTLGSPLLANAARWLPRLTFLEFYICDIITTPVITAFANSCPNLLVVKVPGCANVTDEAIIAVATHCRRLRHLDARACSLIGDRAVLQIARNCPDLAHINVGRIGGGDRITYQSISEVARRTKVDTLGLAGCDISDSTVLAIAMHRRSGLERVSFNNCPRITDRAVEALVQYCPRMAVLELKECFCVTDFRLVWRLMQKRVLVELCAAGRQRLEQFQRAELAKIAAAQERPGGAGGGGGGGGAADGESQRRRTGAAAAAAAAAASAAKEPAPTSSA